jgi:hypothetical protein
MKNAQTQLDLDTDQMGQYFSAQLTQATSELPHDIHERLRVARQTALAQRKPMVQSRRVQTAHVNSHGTLTSSGDEGLNLWSVLASAVPLLALLVGLLAIQWIQDDSIALELAATDSALLTDELPPDAYTDAGFAQFLKLNHSTSKPNE